MIKKALCLFISVACLSASCAASAKTVVTGDVSENGTATVSVGTDFQGDTRHLVTVFKPDTDVDAIKTDGSKNNGVADFKMIEPDTKDGYAFSSASFTLSGYGIYTATVGGGELEEYEEVKLVHISKTDSLAEGKKATGAAKAGALADLLDENETLKAALDLENEAYVSNKANVIENMTEQLKDMSESSTTVQDVVNVFNRSVALAELKNCTDTKELAESIPAYEKLLYGGAYPESIKDAEYFADIFKGVLKDPDMKAEGSKLNTPEDFRSIIRITDALVEVNKADAKTVLDKLKDYDDVFKLDYSGDYKKVDRYELSKYMADLSVEYKTVGDVKDKFEDSIKKLPKKNDKGNSGGGSSGGGGGTRVTSGPSGSAVIDSELIATLDEAQNGTYSDLDEAEWAKAYINYLAENNIMNGDGNGLFRPNDSIKREELLKLIIEALKFEKAVQSDKAFEDVADGEWYFDYVNAGVYHGVVNGISDTEFGVGENVTRQDAAVMLYRALGVSGMTFEKDASADFTDADKIADYATEAVSVLFNEKVISGYETGEFMPEGKLTRAEAAKLIYGIIKLAV